MALYNLKRLQDFQESNFILQKGARGISLVNEKTGEPLGLFIGEWIRSDECQAASVVYEKYKRKHNLQHIDLRHLSLYILGFSIGRQHENKKVNKDILIQECGRYFKNDFLPKYLLMLETAKKEVEECLAKK